MEAQQEPSNSIIPLEQIKFNKLTVKLLITTEKLSKDFLAQEGDTKQMIASHNLFPYFHYA